MSKNRRKQNSNYKRVSEGKTESDEQNLLGNEKKKPAVNFRLIVTLIITIVLSCAICYMGRASLNISPLSTTHSFEGPTNVFAGKNGMSYVIDGGKKKLIVLNEEGKLSEIINGGDEDSGYFYASLVCDDDDGNIYVCDVVYSGEGTKLSKERILKYDKKASGYEIILDIDYSEEENPPMQYGNILSLSVSDGVLTYTMITSDGISVNELDVLSKQNTEMGSYVVDRKIVAADYDEESGSTVFSTRYGNMFRIDSDGKITSIFDADDSSIPWSISASSGKVFFADFSDGALKSVPLDTEKAAEYTVEYEFGDLSTVSIENGNFVGTNCAGVYIGELNSEYSYTEAPQISNFVLRIVVWICAVIGACAALALACLIVASVVHGKGSETIYRVIIVLVVSLLISILVSYLILSSMLTNQNETIMKELNSFCDIMIETTDTENLVEIKSIDDYKGEEFNSVKDGLDNLIRKSYDSGLYYYYAIYTTDGETIFCVMDFEDTVTSRHPVYPYGYEGYTEVLTNGDNIEVSSDISSYGAWSFVLKPIYDDNGNIIALMEVGTSLDQILANQRELIFEIAITVVSTVVVIIMFMLEVIFFMSFSDKRKRFAKAELDITDAVPLRTLIFITYLADSMQDSFITLLSARLFDDSSFIPREIGITLPLSAQVLMAAIFAFVGGKLVNVIGTKKNLIIGISAEIIGFTVCAVSGTYWGILVGKTLFGIGMGLVIVTINTIAALGKTEESSASAFAGINAGVLAGVTAGVGIGSVILSISDYRSVYFAAVVLIVLSLLITIRTPDRKTVNANSVEEKKPVKLNAFTFTFKREIITFAILLLVPFMIALSYREVFFPLYSESFGLNEVWIGRIYLICGLVIIYIGPVLTKFLIEKLGNKWTVVLASALMCLIMLLFVLCPTLEMSIVGLIILSVAISFGYAAQSTYYSSLKTVGQFGEGRAMGVYSLFENAGQTLGPVIYSVALAMMGNVFGLAIIGCAMVVLLMLFVLANSFKAKKKN